MMRRSGDSTGMAFSVMCSTMRFIALMTAVGICSTVRAAGAEGPVEPRVADATEPGRLQYLQAQDDESKKATQPGADRRRRGARPPTKTPPKGEPTPGQDPATQPVQPADRQVTPPPQQPPQQPPQHQPTGETETVSSHLNVDAEQLGLSPEDRTYTFSIVDGSYKELVENFARMAGVGVVGEAPVGTTTFVSMEEMSYKAALNRVRMLLFKYKPLEPYWLVRNDKHFEVKRVTDVWRDIPLEQIFTNVAAFEQSGIDDEELAMVQYTPTDTSVADFTLLRDFMPDYVRIAPMADTNSLAIFALVRDIKKYLSLIKLFEGAGDDPRVIEKLVIHYVTPTEAVEGLRRLMDDLEESGAAVTPQRAQRAGEVPIDLPGQRTVLFPDDAQGVLIVRAVPKKIESIKEFLPYVDVDTAPPDSDPVKIPIKYATVDEIINILNPLITAGAGGVGGGAAVPNPGGEGVPNPQTRRPPRSRRGGAASKAQAASAVTTAVLQLIPDQRTNTLIVNGSELDVERVKRLVALFDVPHEGDRPEFVQLLYASADQMAANVTQIVTAIAAKRPDGAFSAIADVPSNSLVLVGTSEEVAQAKYLISKMDAGDATSSLHSYRLNDALPSKAMEIIKLMESQQAAPGAAPASPAATKNAGRSRRRQQPQAAVAGGNIYADDTSMMIYIVCSDEEWNQNYKPLLEQLDAQAGQVADHVSIPVTFLSPEEVIQTLNELFGANPKRPGAIKFAATASAVLVSGATPSEVGQIKSIVEDVDRETQGRERRLFTIEHVDPAEIRAIIESGVVGKLTTGRRAGKGAAVPVPAAEDAVVAAVIDRTLVVSGLPAQLDEVADLIDRLDVAAAHTNEIRVYSVPSGHDVHSIVSLIEALVSSSPRVTTRRQNPAGAAAGVPATSVQVEDIRFIPQPSARRFIVSAPLEKFEDIEAAIGVVLEGAPSERSEIEFFATHHVEAGMIASLIEPILLLRAQEMAMTGDIAPETAEGGKAARGGMMRSSTVTVSTDATNSRVVVMAPPTLIAEARSLIAELDRAPDDEKRVVKTITLKKASAEEMVMAIHAMLSGERAVPAPATPRVRNRGNDPAKAAGAAGAGAAPAVAGVANITAKSDDVTVVPAPGGRGILVSGTVDAVAEVEEWVRILDDSASSDMVLKVYHIKNADIEQLADTIMDLCDAGVSRAPVAAGGKGGSTSGDLLDSDFELPGGVRRGSEVTLTTDYWNKVILVRATPLKMFEVDQIVELYDGSEDAPAIITAGPPTPFLIYELENVRPFDAVSAFEDLLDVVWTHGEEPKVDYISGTDNMVVKCLPEYNAEIEELIKKYIDKSGKKKSATAVAYETISGETAGRVAARLKLSVPGIKVNLEQLDEEVPVIEELGPYQPSKDGSAPSGQIETPKQDGKTLRRCVLPLSLIESAGPIAAMAMGQATGTDAGGKSQAGADPEKKEDADKQNVAAKMKESLAGQTPSAPDAAGTPKGEAAAELTPEVNVRFDDRQGVLVIEGPPQAVEDVRDALSEIMDEIESIGSSTDIRVFRIRYRNVTVAAQILETMFNAAMTPQQQQLNQQRMAMQAQVNQRMQMQQMQQLARGQQPGQPVVPPTAGKDPAAEGEEEEEPKKQGPGEIRIYPDPQTRTLIIRAAKEDFPIIVDLLATIDRPADVEEEFRIFQFEHLIASEVESQLKELFGISRPASQPSMRRQPNQRGRGGQAGQVQTPMQQFEEQLLNMNAMGFGGEGGAIDVASDIKITSNPTANTLLVMAPKPALEMIDKFIEELEKQTIPIMATRTYKVQYADATELAAQLKDMFGAPGRGAGAGDQDGFDPTTINKVTVSADARTNTLLVSAYEPDFVHIEPLIQKLDAKLEGQDNVVTIKLESADATATATTLTSIYASASGGPRGAGAGAKAVKFVGDAASGILFITAPADQREQILARVREIDAEAAKQTQPKTIQLTEGKAVDVARALQAAFDGRRGSVKFFGDEASNKILVTAPDELFEQIETLAKAMDKSSTAIETRVFKLEHARATAVHTHLMDMVRQLATQLKNRNIDVFSAVADERSNTIVCVGGPVSFALVEQIIKEVDIPQSETGSTRTRQILALEHASATDLARIIGDDLRATSGGAPSGTGGRGAAAGATSVSIIANESLNSLLISGTNEEVQGVVALAKEMDKSSESGEVEIIALKYNDAEAMKGVLETYLAKPGQSGGRGGAPGGLRGDVRISANAQNNTIILSGTRQQLDEIKGVVAELDVAVEDAGNAPKIIPIKYARASQIEPMLTRMFVDVQRPSGRSGATSGMTPVITSDEVSNSVIVRCSAGDLGQIMALIEQLDTETTVDPTTFTVVPVAEGVKVADLADMVQTTINEGERIKADRWGTEPGTLIVTADTRTNALVLAGSASLFPDAERLVRQMETMGPTGGRTMKVINTINLPPDEVRRLLDGIIGENEGGRSGSGSRAGSGGSSSARPRSPGGASRRPTTQGGATRRPATPGGGSNRQSRPPGGAQQRPSPQPKR